MKKSRFSEQQIAFILKQGDEGVAVAEICRTAKASRPPSNDIVERLHLPMLDKQGR